jgi:serine protease Do
MGMTIPSGVLVNKLTPKSPAEAAGIKVGDVILSMNGLAINSEQDLQYRLALARIGDEAKFTVRRQGRELPISVKLEAPRQVPRDERLLKGNHPLAGVTVANLSPALAAELDIQGADSGVIILKGTGFGVLPGDIILEVNGTKIDSTAALEKLLAKPARRWQMTIARDGVVMALTVQR